ncbi:MAG: ATP-binding protein [Desulfoplanes sp.]
MDLLSLRVKFRILLIGLVMCILTTFLVTVWHLYHIDRLFSEVVNEDIVALQVAEELQTALVMQKGFVTYYFLQGTPHWLTKLEQYNQSFQDWLQKARQTSHDSTTTGILDTIESKYLAYAMIRAQVIQLYKDGKRDQGAKLHWTARNQFFNIVDLCAKYKNIYKQSITNHFLNVSKQKHRLNIITGTLFLIGFVFASFLAFIIFNRVLAPIHELVLALQQSLTDSFPNNKNEIIQLTRRVKRLISNVNQTRTKLEESQEHLQQNEKLATIGKLGAGVAHSVRNPLTSVKMRLFSLQRSLKLDNVQEEDFEVISEEIRHIDTILSNFLEFSRRPKLKPQKSDLSEIVTMALQLMQHRLESYGITAKNDIQEKLPLLMVDQDQIKEILVNLLENACDAMNNGGEIIICAKQGVVEPLGHVVVMTVKDNGPGIPEELQDKIFQPFFSAKEEGTGLGLSIAKRIIEDHGGWISVSSKPEEGTTFTITLPCGRA